VNAYSMAQHALTRKRWCALRKLSADRCFDIENHYQ